MTYGEHPIMPLVAPNGVALGGVLFSYEFIFKSYSAQQSLPASRATLKVHKNK